MEPVGLHHDEGLDFKNERQANGVKEIPIGSVRCRYDDVFGDVRSFPRRFPARKSKNDQSQPAHHGLAHGCVVNGLTMHDGILPKPDRPALGMAD